jgi:Trp operon repressor
MSIPSPHLRQLWQLLASIENEKEAKMLMEDLLTPQEIESIAERWQIVQQLDKELPQREIAEKLKASIVKVTRGARVLRYGSGGFRHFLEKMKNRKGDS